MFLRRCSEGGIVADMAGGHTAERPHLSNKPQILGLTGWIDTLPVLLQLFWQGMVSGAGQS